VTAELVGLWTNKASGALATRVVYYASAVTVYVTLEKKNPLCQNSFPAQGN